MEKSYFSNFSINGNFRAKNRIGEADLEYSAGGQRRIEIDREYFVIAVSDIKGISKYVYSM